jgi:hypothetical protein
VLNQQEGRLRWSDEVMKHSLCHIGLEWGVDGKPITWQQQEEKLGSFREIVSD